MMNIPTNNWDLFKKTWKNKIDENNLNYFNKFDEYIKSEEWKKKNI